MDDLARFVVDLDRTARLLPSRARAATSRTVDEVRDTARQMAVSQWSKHGRGMAGSAGAIEARMSRDRSQATGFVMVGGPWKGDPAGIGGFMQEVGTSRHPPNPVLTPAAERHADRWEERLADIPEDLLR